VSRTKEKVWTLEKKDKMSPTSPHILKKGHLAVRAVGLELGSDVFESLHLLFLSATWTTGCS